MKKHLILLFVVTFICGILSCGDNSTPTDLVPETYDGNPFVYECLKYDPRTHHSYVKNMNYGIIRELDSDEKDEIIQNMVVECSRSVCRYDYGGINYNQKVVDNHEGTSYSFDNYHGGCSNLYQNALERYYKDYRSSPDTLPVIRSVFKEGYDYTFVDATYYPYETVVTGCGKRFSIDEKRITIEPFICPFGEFYNDKHFNKISQSLTDTTEREIKAYKTISGYLLKPVPLGELKENYDVLYSYYETVYIFNESKQLTNYFDYYEITEIGKQDIRYNGCDKQLNYEIYKYDESGERPIKDLWFVKDALEEADYLYLEHPSFKLGQVENKEDIANMSDSDFATEVKCDYFESYFAADSNHFGIVCELEIPYVNDDNKKYNAVLNSFTFKIIGTLNGQSFARTISFRLFDDEQCRDLSGKTKNGTGVTCLLDEDIKSDTKQVFYLQCIMGKEDNEIILSDDMNFTHIEELDI